MNTSTDNTKLTFLYIFIAFTFSIVMRLIWIYQFNGYEPFVYNGQLMINTNDGYCWAEGARDILSGVSQSNDLSPIDRPAAQLTAFFASILPFSFESIILYIPVFLSSLIVIPIILIAKNLKNLEMGLIAAMLASIAWSYYNRTMAGYFDTDMLNIVLPMFLLWSIILAVQTNKNIYLLLTALDILVYRWWYPQSYSLEFSFFGLILLYALIFDRKNLYNYKLMAIMMFAMMGLDGFTRLGLVLVSFFLFTQKSVEKYTYHILALSITSFLITGGLSPIWSQLKGYVFKESIHAGSEGLKLHFFSVVQTVREAGNIPFETFANRISGHPITFVVSLAGYVYLAFKYRIMLFGLPLIGLGFLAMVGGLRFTVYAVPLLAFGIAFLITEISQQIQNKSLKYASMALFTFLVIYPNYKHIDAYKVPTVFNAQEVKILDDLKGISHREDYVISWWDYGYPIRYYADVKTLVDGGKHNGDVNFPVSFILTSPPSIAAKMARLDVEYTENAFKTEAKNKLGESNITLASSNIEQMTLDYGFTDTNDFLRSLSKNIKLPKKTRDVYLYLPYKMLNILPTVTLFSNMNLMTGKQNKSPLFFMSKNFKNVGDTINLGRGISLNKRTGYITLGKQKVQLKRFITTAYDKKMKLQKNIQNINVTSNLSLIFMSNYNTFLLLDEKMYNSLYIQLMVLENIDSNLFEAVVLNPQVKIYKLKI